MLLLQPQTKEYEETLAFAEENGIGFELMDFSYPAILDDRRTVAKLMKRYKGTPVHSIHGVFIDINYSGGDRLIFDASRRRIEECASLAYKVGAPRIVLHSCFFPIMPKDDILYDIWSEEAAVLLTRIAEKYHVEFYIENVLDISPDIILKMVKKANHPKISVCLDVGHANLTKLPVVEWIEALAPYIRHVHLSDNGGTYDDHIALGDGNIDWRLVDDTFRRCGVVADYTMEVKPFANVKKSYEFLKNGGMPYVFGQ